MQRVVSVKMTEEIIQGTIQLHIIAVTDTWLTNPTKQLFSRSSGCRMHLYDKGVPSFKEHSEAEVLSINVATENEQRITFSFISITIQVSW